MNPTEQRTRPLPPPQRVQAAQRGRHADPRVLKLAFRRHRHVAQPGRDPLLPNLPDHQLVTHYQWANARLDISVYVPESPWRDAAQLVVAQVWQGRARVLLSAQVRDAGAVLDLLSACCLIPVELSVGYSLGWFAGRRSAR